MKAEPFSMVGLLAVGHENVMLGTDNTISKSVVTDELLGYDSAEISDYFKSLKNEASMFPWKPGGSNIHSGIQVNMMQIRFFQDSQ